MIQRRPCIEPLEARIAPAFGAVINLSPTTFDAGDGFRLDGDEGGPNNTNTADYSGRSVSDAGDFNGDGIADLMVGADFADTAGGTHAGEFYVVFGRRDSTRPDVDLANLGAGGFRILGASAEGFAGFP